MRASHREVEIKLRVARLGEILGRLAELKAERVGSVREWNELYDTPKGELRRKGSILRLRREVPAAPPGKRRGRGRRSNAGRGVLTYKGKVRSNSGRSKRYKIREESEVRIEDSAAMGHILRALGPRTWFRYEKFRTRYRLKNHPGLHVDLDETPIGCFLELEGPRGAIERLARALGYAPKDYLAVSYLALYLEDCRRRRKKPGDMLFQP